MKNIRGLENGLTLIEILVSIVLILILVTATAGTMLTSQFVSSYAKHKTQAAYVAQQIIEQERRLTFVNIISLGTAVVTLDTKGTYGTTTDDFLGNRIITVTNIDPFRKMVLVEINWQEQLTRGKITMREYFKTTIANEPELN